MNPSKLLKPATVTSIGFLTVAIAYVFETPPLFLKIGWGIVAIGTVWFFLKRG